MEKKTPIRSGNSNVRRSNSGFETKHNWKPTAADRQLKKAWEKTYSNRNQKKAS